MAQNLMVKEVKKKKKKKKKKKSRAGLFYSHSNQEEEEIEKIRKIHVQEMISKIVQSSDDFNKELFTKMKEMGCFIPTRM